MLLDTFSCFSLLGPGAKLARWSSLHTTPDDLQFNQESQWLSIPAVLNIRFHALPVIPEHQ
jgi:hypothetical protein